MEFDPEYEELIAMKLATKDTKYDFKAQIAVAKDFSQRAKALMRTMRDQDWRRGRRGGCGEG